jgi:hypothetical protein
MRHNPAAGAITIMLRSLKMHSMAQAVGELTEQGSLAFEAALPIRVKSRRKSAVATPKSTYVVFRTDKKSAEVMEEAVGQSRRVCEAL